MVEITNTLPIQTERFSSIIATTMLEDNTSCLFQRVDLADTSQANTKKGNSLSCFWKETTRPCSNWTAPIKFSWWVALNNPSWIHYEKFPDTIPMLSWNVVKNSIKNEENTNTIQNGCHSMFAPDLSDVGSCNPTWQPCHGPAKTETSRNVNFPKWFFLE